MAVISGDKLVTHQVIDTANALALIQQLSQQWQIDLIVMGDGTTSKYWRDQIAASLSSELSIVTVDETNSTLEARDRYWSMYPPTGLQRFIPQGLRTPPRPVDDLVAILLIERYLFSYQAEEKQ